MKTFFIIGFCLCVAGAHAFGQGYEVSRILVHPEPLYGQTVRASNNFTIPRLPPGSRTLEFQVIPAYPGGDWRHVRFSVYRDLRFRWDETVFSNVRFSRRYYPARPVSGNLYVGNVNNAPGPFWVVVQALPIDLR